MTSDHTPAWQQLSHSRVKHIVVEHPKGPHFVTKTLCGLATTRTMFTALESSRPCWKCSSRLEAHRGE